jgi:hypothetical protein
MIRNGSVFWSSSIFNKTYKGEEVLKAFTDNTMPKQTRQRPILGIFALYPTRFASMGSHSICALYLEYLSRSPRARAPTFTPAVLARR